MLMGACSSPNFAAKAESPWISGYYVGYQRHLYPPQAIDFDHLTHLIIGRILPKSDGGLDTALDLDAKQGPLLAQNLARLTQSKGKTPLLFVGGAGVRDAWLAATAPSIRGRFAKNLLQTMKSWGFAGLDLDWEPITREDGPRVLALVRELRLARPDIILSIPVGWINPNRESIDSIYAEIAKYVDRLNIMSYGMSGAWLLWKSWHSSALYSPSRLTPSSVDATVKAYIAAGVPKEKLGVGAGFYGSCWAGSVTGPGQFTTGATIVAADNEMSYTNIMRDYYDAEHYRFDETAGAPYLTFATGRGPRKCSFLSYEDEKSLQLKGAYIKQQGLGGAIMWTVNQGYRPDATDKNPLLKALYRAIMGRP